MSTHKDALDAIASDIASLSLSGCEAVKVRAAPKDRGRWYDGITVHPVKEDERAGTNERDDIGYACQVTMVVNNNEDLDEADLFGTWRQTIRKKFIHQRLTGVDDCYTCLVEPGPVYVDNEKNYDIGTMIIRVLCRETRG